MDKNTSIPRVNRNEVNSYNFKMVDAGDYDITKMTDDQLRNLLLQTWSSVPGNYKFDAMAQLLASETQRRLTLEMKRGNDLSSRWSMLIAGLAIMISLVTLAVAVLDYRSGNEWQREEMRLLHEQIILLKAKSTSGH